jgi:hypothetical protein
LFVVPCVWALANQIEFMRQMHTGAQRLAVASVAGTIMVARSPAAAIAVLREVDGRGPFCSLTLSVIVAKDVVVIVLFGLNLAAVRFAEKVTRTPTMRLEMASHPHASPAADSHPTRSLFCLLVSCPWMAVACGVWSVHRPRRLMLHARRPS